MIDTATDNNSTNTQSGYRLGIDIGGSKMRAILIDRKNKVLEDYQLATPKDSLNHLLIMIKATIEPLIERANKDQMTIDSLGIGIAGTLDEDREKILVSPNLTTIENTKLLARLQTEFNWTWPMLMDNDANCFTRGEALLGAGAGLENVYGITIGTGIGAGWWYNGEIYAGASGAANELSDMLIDVDHQVTLEQAYQKLTQNNARLLAQEAYEGDILAEKAFAELGAYLGLGFANIVNLLDPSMLVVGGGVAAVSELFLGEAKRTMEENTPSHRHKTKITQTKLGDNAGAIGAALLFR
jgi:glucokinase